MTTSEPIYANIGIDYEYWEPVPAIPPDLPPEQILTIYEKQIDELKSWRIYDRRRDRREP